MSSRIPGYFLSRPVESLQHMLRTLAGRDDRLLPVVPDGVYGQNTMAAVLTFQRLHGLPVTGVANDQTWKALELQYQKARIRQNFAEPIRVLMDPGQSFQPSEKNWHVGLVQVMLQALSGIYGGFPTVEVHGKMDENTVQAVRHFQELCGLSPTGAVNRQTWRYLARSYTMAAGNGERI